MSAVENNAEIAKPDELDNEKKISKKDRKKQHSASKKEYLKARREEYQANKQVGYTKETLNETEYYFEDGLRKVKVRK